jgi:ABC-type antimicrobial peptide transport system permease subunit
VFQNFNLLGRLTALENVEMPLTYAGVEKSERQSRAMRALESVRLSHRHNHWPRQLSGGEQQRVAIARALVVDPLLILADEPTGAIDSRTGREVLELFRTLNRADRTIVVITHDPNVADYADRIVSMQDGRIVGDQVVARHGQQPLIKKPRGDVTQDTLLESVGRSGAINATESLAIAARALRANLTRSLLTMLGIVVGVAAVITMVAAGEGAKMRITEQIRSFGTNILLVQPGSADHSTVQLGAGTAMSLTEADAMAIEQEIAGVQVAAPGVSGTAQLVHGNRNWSTLIGGVTPSYLIAREWQVDKGRSFNAEEVASAAKVVLLGSATVDQLFKDQNPLDQVVRIGNVPFTVIGVLNKKGQNAAGNNQDDVALLPLSTAKLRILGRYSQLNRLAIDYMLVKLSQGVSLNRSASEITSLLRQRHRIRDDVANDFIVTDPTAAVQTQVAATRTFSLLLFSISAVSLIVGGIGIMNIMLVSVTERTREIGIRLAVGARRRDLRVQFLVEAMTLCLVGGVVGTLVGALAGWSIAQLAGWSIFLGPSVVLLAVGSAGLIGIFFGFYPAHKASSLNPIEALRFE